jgi:capsule polysaccharide export protein KpsE/RkpR
MPSKFTGKMHYCLELDGSLCEVMADLKTFKSLQNPKTPKIYILRWKCAIPESRGKMTNYNVSQSKKNTVKHP